MPLFSTTTKIDLISMKPFKCTSKKLHFSHQKIACRGRRGGDASLSGALGNVMFLSSTVVQNLHVTFNSFIICIID